MLGISPRPLVTLQIGALLSCCNPSTHEPSRRQSTGVAASGAGETEAPPLNSLRMPDHEGPTLGVPPKLHAIGEQAVARDYTMKVHKIAQCQVEPHFAAKPGHIKVGVEVELVGTSSRAVAANPFLASLVDAEQRDYSADLAGCTPALRATRVTRDRRARGVISFEIPEDASQLVMIYAPFVVGVGRETLQFSLGR